MRRVVAAVVCVAAVLTGCTSNAPDPAPTKKATALPLRLDGSPWRPKVHLSANKNWMNDPNGLVYSKGIYHVFYQYNPKGNDWGNMSWGHATSKDLVHWDEQPVAMAATEQQEIFSGSIVVDRLNTSGLGSLAHPAMIALYTSAYGSGSGREGVQAQSMAYSADDGTTWQQYHDNPVVTLDPESKSFRDPKVTWYQPGGYWIMTTVVADGQVVKIYKSKDLRSWDFLSDFSGVGASGGLWEMPELIEMPVEGQSGARRWVLLVSVNPGGIAGGSGMQYFVGKFDGTRFVADGAASKDAPLADHQWLDYGADYYAATTVSDAPGGKPVLVGWMNNWDYAADVPTKPWRGAMAIPRELTLQTVDGKLRLTSAISGRAALALRTGGATDSRLAPKNGQLAAPVGMRGSANLFDVTIRPSRNATAGVIVRASADGKAGTRVSYDGASGMLTLDRSRSGNTSFSPKFSPEHAVRVPLQDGQLNLTVLVDNSSVEVFAQGGRAVLTDLIFPAAGSDRVFAFAEGGQADVGLRAWKIGGTAP